MIINQKYNSKGNFIMTKIGRNSPCPCGSGLKYKNCCLNKKRNNSIPRYQVGIYTEKGARKGQTGT